MGRRVLFKLFDATWGLSSVIPAMLCIGGFMASRFHPEKYADLQWLGIFLPVILGVNMLLVVYWMIRRKCWFIIPLLAVLVNVPNLGNMVQWPYKQAQPAKEEITFATYNIQHGWAGNTLAVATELGGILEEEGVEVICFQEFPASGDLQEEVSEALHHYPYHVVHAASPHDLHVALYSKYPILRSGLVPFQDESNNNAMWADVQARGDTIRLFNCHLQTTSLNQARYHLAGIPETGQVLRLRELMNENGVTRARQAGHIRERMDHSPFPVIVCGDFNDTPASYTYRKIKGDLEDSFQKAGRGYGYTYRYPTLRRFLRIDYVLYSKSTFRATRYHSPDLDYSDHKPVIVTLGLNLSFVKSEE